jgi:GT2 family glycosyltransferase
MVRNDQTMRWELVRESWRAPNVATALIRRSAFTIVGPFDESVTGGDDVDWLLRAKEIGVREAHVEAITLHYRRHGGNMTNDVATDQSRLLRVLGRAVARRRAAGATTQQQPAAKPGERS